MKWTTYMSIFVGKKKVENLLNTTVVIAESKNLDKLANIHLTLAHANIQNHIAQLIRHMANEVVNLTGVLEMRGERIPIEYATLLPFRGLH